MVTSSELAELRRRLLEIANRYGVDASIAREIGTDDALAWCLGMTDLQLSRWLNLRGTRAAHDRGLLSGAWLIPQVAHAAGGR